MSAKPTQVHLGFEVGSGAPVEIPIRHMAVTGQTQESGKTTTLTALISRAKLPAIAFLTKRGEASLHGRQILPFFQERADWPFVQSILESTMRERMKFERAWIVRACKGARTLADVQRNVERLQEKEKRALSQDIYMLLGEYLQRVVPLIATLPKTSRVDIGEGLAVMDLVRYPLELQMLVISSTLEWIHKHAEGVITLLPEAWKFVPQGRKTPVQVSAELLYREGAGLKNYLWVDSQDMAAVDKPILRACAVWLIGVQREANEIKRALANMPAGMKKPNAGDVGTLELGQFFACYGREIRKTYVQPAWMSDNQAVAVATAKVHVHTLLSQLQDEEDEGMDWKALYEEEKRERERLQDEVTDLRTRLGLPNILALSGSPETTATVARAVVQPGAAHSGPAAPVHTSAPEAARVFRDDAPESLYQSLKERLMQESPALIKVLAERPEIRVEVNRSVVNVDDSSLKGKIALLIHEGWFDENRNYGDIRKEMIRRGLDSKTPNFKISDALKDFIRMGFFWQGDSNTYELAPGAKKRVAAA